MLAPGLVLLLFRTLEPHAIRAAELGVQVEPDDPSHLATFVECNCPINVPIRRRGETNVAFQLEFTLSTNGLVNPAAMSLGTACRRLGLDQCSPLYDCH
jgi:hypothetical protein